MNEVNVCLASLLVVLGRVAIRAGELDEALEILTEATYILDTELGLKSET